MSDRHDELEHQFRQALRGRHGTYLKGRLFLDGEYSPEQLREIAGVADRMQAAGVELVEVSSDSGWEPMNQE